MGEANIMFPIVPVSTCLKSINRHRWGFFRGQVIGNDSRLMPRSSFFNNGSAFPTKMRRIVYIWPNWRRLKETKSTTRPSQVSKILQRKHLRWRTPPSVPLMKEAARKRKSRYYTSTQIKSVLIIDPAFLVFGYSAWNSSGMLCTFLWCNRHVIRIVSISTFRHCLVQFALCIRSSIHPACYTFRIRSIRQATYPAGYVSGRLCIRQCIHPA